MNEIYHNVTNLIVDTSLMTVMIYIAFIIPSLIIIWTTSVILHEMAHYIAANFFKLHPKYFITGTTFPLFRKLNSLITFNYKGTFFSLNPFSTSGSVETFSYICIEENKNKMIIISFAGPTINLIIGILALEIYQNNYLMDLININFYLILIYLVVIMNLFLSANFLPIHGSDGWYIYQLLKKQENRNEKSKDKKIHIKDEEAIISKEVFENFLKPCYDKNC